MTRSSKPVQSERVLICAPFGRDGALIEKALVAAGLTAHVCRSVPELAGAIEEGAGTALIADEALRGEYVISCLRTQLAKQPPWSDFPLVIMTSGGDTTDASRSRLRLLEPLGNVNLLERPLRAATLISSLRAALRARRHQYQLAAHLEERGENELEIAKQNEALLKVNRELEEFAYVASHDLQEPLRMINIYTQLLVKQFGSESEMARKYAHFVEQGVKRMEKLLTDLLRYSRTTYTEKLKVETADLSRSLAQAMAALKERIEESGADIRFTELPKVAGDEGQLAQVFQNLLSNALKYRQENAPPKITIAAERRGVEWIVSVSDNGIGFEQQYSERIFGLFKRLHKDEYPGTGLGLAICQRIIERSGGRMWAEGHPGDGATFYFAVPSKPGDC